jgi:uncharacterized protein involved in exopolysaccharide biosynthesis
LSYKEILNAVKKNLGLILKLSIISTFILFLILFFVFPITYSSGIKLLPPEEKKYNAVNSLLGYSDITGLANYSFAEGSSQLYSEILKSRKAAEYVVDKCGLLSYFDTDNKYVASERLIKLLNVTVSKEGIISLEVVTHTPLFGRFSSANKYVKELTSKIANTYADALDNINYEMLNTRVRKSREYIESQLIKTKYLLDSAETSLRIFQEKNKTVALPEQLNASIETATKLKSEMIFTEIQMGTLLPNMKEDNMIISGLQKKLEELKSQYNLLENGGNAGKDLLPSFSEAPRLEQQLERLVREVKIQNEVYLLLQKQYYIEKISENQNLPTVAVLDNAIVPMRENSPRLVFHTCAGGLAIFLLITFIFVVIENKKYSEKIYY